MNPTPTENRPTPERLKELEARLKRLEASLHALPEERRRLGVTKEEIERRRLLENLPLTALIVVLALLASRWIWSLLGF